MNNRLAWMKSSIAKLSLMAITAWLAALPMNVRAANFAAGDLAILIANTATSNDTGCSVVEINTTVSAQAAIQTITIPSTGANAILISGSATSTGYAADSNDSSLFAFTGINNTTVANVNTLNPRAVVTVNNAGTISLATTYTGASGNQTRGATTVNNATWFIGDQGGFYSNGSTVASPSGNIRSVKSFGGIVYGFTASTTAAPVGIISAATGGTYAGLTGLANGAASRQDFYLISSAGNNTYDTLYVLDATSATAGTIFKYSLVSGTWTANGNATTTFGGFGLCAAKSGSGAVLYVTTGTGATAVNSVIKLTDTAGYNSTIAITPANNVTLYTAATGNGIKGIAFAPLPTYTATYNANATLVSGSAPTDSSSPYVSGATVTVLGNSGNMVRTGFTFNGWNTASDGSGTSYAANANFAINANTTLYAKWMLAIVTSATSLASSANPSTYKQSVTFTASVQTNGVTAGNATSNYVFKVDGVAVSTNAVSSGQATYTTSALLAGTHSITAGYAGDVNYTTSTNNPLTQTVNKATTTATLAVNNSPATYTGSGQSAMVNVTASNTPGSVQNILTGSVATQTVSGTYAVTASYLPTDTNYTTLTGVAAGNFVINKATPLVASAPSVTAITYGQTLASSALSGGSATNSTGAPISGTFAFATPTIVLNAGSTNVSVTFTTADTNYFAATATASVVVNQAALTISGLTGTSKIYDGLTNASFTGTAAYAGLTNGDAFTVTGTPSVSFATATVGTNKTVTVTDYIAPSANYSLTQPTLTADITLATLNVTANGTNRSYGMANPTFSASFSGFVNSEDAGVLSGTPNLTTAATTASNVGTYPIVATNGSLSATNYTFIFVNATLTVNPTISTVAISSSANPAGYFDAVSFTGAVPANATGSIVFLAGNSPLSTNAVSGGSATSASVNTLPRGTNLITTIYGGDGNYSGSTNTFSEVVTNHAPGAVNDAYTRAAGIHSLRITISDLFTNDSDADGDTLSLVSVSATTNGITLVTNSTFILYNNPVNVADQFTYTVADGFGGTATATVNILLGQPGTGQVQSISLLGGVATLQFAGIPGYSYSVERSVNLTDWVSIYTTNAPAGSWQVTDDLGVNPPASAFYRLRYNP